MIIGYVAAKEKDNKNEVIVKIDNSDKTQYHNANFDTSSYNYGYEVGPNGQFHHEIRGPDGVTYGCYGYIDPESHLRATHYVADENGYRVIEPEDRVEIFPPSGDENAPKAKKGIIVEWKDLYLPKGCGMHEGGFAIGSVLKQIDGGGFVVVSKLFELVKVS